MAYEQMLRGVQSLFATIPFGNREAFHQYVETMRLDANFSGIQAIGLVQWVPAPDKAAHLAAIRAEGVPAYAIDPEGLRAVYAPIIQREPRIGRNLAPAGSDVGSSRCVGLLWRRLAIPAWRQFLARSA